MKISEFDRRIIINKYIFGQDESGGNIKANSESFNIWAKLEPLSGSRYLDNLQVTYSKAFKITIRNEISRPLANSDEIFYDDGVYVIQSITRLDEGQRSFNVLIAYTSGDISNTGDVIYRVANVIHFTGTGTEYSLQDDRLINWESLIVFRNGIEYRLVAGTPSGKQVRYDKNTGELFFDTNIDPLQLNEAVDIYLITKSTMPATGLTNYYTKAEIDAQKIIEEEKEGISITVTAGQDLSSWHIVYINAGKAYYYDPMDETMTGFAIGITKNAALNNNTVEVQTEGIFEATGLGLIADKKYYAGLNGTMVTSITGLKVLQEIGKSITADKLDIQFNSPYITN